MSLNIRFTNVFGLYVLIPFSIYLEPQFPYCMGISVTLSEKGKNTFALDPKACLVILPIDLRLDGYEYVIGAGVLRLVFAPPFIPLYAVI